MSTSVTVTYCTSCDYLSRALWLAGEVLGQLQYDLASFTFVPGDRGIFDWAVDGETVFSKGAAGRFPEPEELLQAISAKLDG